MATPVDSMKAPALEMLSRGEATITEVARLFGKPHQTVRNWAAGLDTDTARLKYLARLKRIRLRAAKQ